MPPSFLLSNAALTLEFAINFSFACSFASDPRWNYKLLERPWYGFWCTVLIDLFAGIPECMVFPQYPRFFIPEIDDRDDVTLGLVDEEEEEEGNSLLPGIPQVDEHSPQADEDSDDGPELVYCEEVTLGWGDFRPSSSPSSSRSSTEHSPSPSTASIPKGLRITHFAVLHLTGMVGYEPFNALSSGIATITALQALRVKISNMLIPLILENKKGFADPSRNLIFAKTQVREQARFLFHQNRAQSMSSPL